MGLLAAWMYVHAQPSEAPRSQSAKSALPGRWQTTLDAFAEADRTKAPPPGGVLFIGSSSIRLWDGLETGFANAPTIIKRGFGGSRLSDCASLIERLVVPYQPRLVVVYAGDNDLAEGASPEDVLAQFQRFVEGVHQTLPETRIAFVSVKPSPARVRLLPKARAANALIEAYANSTRNTDFIDIFSPMLGPDGLPRGDLFRADALHLNEAGYALWRGIIADHLAPAAPAAPSRDPVVHAGASPRPAPAAD